ncbi:MAG: hypothetical protein KDI71_24430 [Xanthomonadales bacterium]|nr:hypothetical protein [Xanthomonadales bacterium]
MQECTELAIAVADEYCQRLETVQSESATALWAAVAPEVCRFAHVMTLRRDPLERLSTSTKTATERTRAAADRLSIALKSTPRLAPPGLIEMLGEVMSRCEEEQEARACLLESLPAAEWRQIEPEQVAFVRDLAATASSHGFPISTGDRSRFGQLLTICAEVAGEARSEWKGIIRAALGESRG